MSRALHTLDECLEGSRTLPCWAWGVLVCAPWDFVRCLESHEELWRPGLSGFPHCWPPSFIPLTLQCRARGDALVCYSALFTLPMVDEAWQPTDLEVVQERGYYNASCSIGVKPRAKVGGALVFLSKGG